jgi:hypothetical protein
VDAFEEDASLVRRSARMLGAAATIVVLGAAVAGSVGFVALGLWVAWVGLGALVYGWARSPGATPQAVRVRADATGLSIDGAMALPSSRIVGGWVEPRPHAPPVVHVQGLHLQGLPSRHLRLVVRDVEQGRALLRSLAIDPSQVSAHYWALARPLGEPRAFAHVGVLLVVTIVAGFLIGPAVPPLFAVAIVAFCVLFAGVMFPTRVVVGGDGVLLRWLGTARFVPWSRVVDIEPFDGGVVLSLGPDRGEELLTLRMPDDHQRYHPEREALVERMVAALRAYGATPRPEPMTRLLVRAGGRTRDWVREMRDLIRPVDGFRTASVPVDRLWQVVLDPRVDREARTGAALALAPTLADEGRARLRAVADGCAEPRLRIALVTAATEAGAPDETLAEALDALESEGVDDHSVAR